MLEHERNEDYTGYRKLNTLCFDINQAVVQKFSKTFLESYMYDIFVKTHFAGAHHLRDYPGDCEHPHGHNWKVKVTVRATELDHLGMGIDFTVLKKHVKEVIDTIDHCDLNKHEAFKVLNPSSEHIAKYIFEHLVDKLDHKRYSLYSVAVAETDNQGLIYYGENKA